MLGILTHIFRSSQLNKTFLIVHLKSLLIIWLLLLLLIFTFFHIEHYVNKKVQKNLWDLLVFILCQCSFRSINYILLFSLRTDCGFQFFAQPEFSHWLFSSRSYSFLSLGHCLPLACNAPLLSLLVANTSLFRSQLQSDLLRGPL